MVEDAESDIAISFVDQNDYREIFAKAVSAKRKLKKNRPSSYERWSLYTRGQVSIVGFDWQNFWCFG